MMPERASHIRAIGVTLIAAILWGLWWIPVEFLARRGFDGVWAAFAFSAGAVPALVIACRVRGLAKRGGHETRALIGGALLGVGAMLYATSLTFTDVVRAVLLFYLAPAWSTAIEVLFLGRRASWWSALAFILAVAGILTIFRFGVTLGDAGFGEIAALLSGFLWSVGAALIYTRPNTDAGMLSVAVVMGMLCASLIVALVAGPAVGAFPGWAFVDSAGVILLLGSLYFVPLLVLTMSSAKKLQPATLSFLLTAEIIAGVVSAAILLDQSLTRFEIFGAILVALAAVTEAVSQRPGKSTVGLRRSTPD